MTALGSQIALVAAVTTGIGVVMIRLGLDRGALVRRRASRTCPSCGRTIERRVCEVCSRT
jgi:exosome complex RNA-binding protein Csl4